MGEQPLLTLVEPREIDPPTRLKLKWEQVQKYETKNVLDKDTQQAEAMAEAQDAGMKMRDIAACVGIAYQRVDQLLRYHRFNTFLENLSTAVDKIPEFRFRQYWQQMSDPFETRGKRTKEYRDQRERRVFLAIVECLEAGKAPIPPNRAPKTTTVEQMFKTKNPLRALRKEVERRFDTELAPIVAKAKDLFGRDRATYSPDFLANAMRDLERWHKNLLQLLADFDKHVD
jgi:hypothetical protein